MPVTALSFILALLALIVAVVGLLLQMIGLWDGIGIALVSLAVITLGAPAVIAGRLT
jgi:hypothetical protein